MRFHLIKQHDIKDCGAACLSMICRFHGLNLPLAKYRKLIKIDNAGTNIYGIVLAAEQIGLKASALSGSSDEFLASVQSEEISFPLIARIVVDDTLEHFVVIYKMTSKHIFIADPDKGKYKLTYTAFFNTWSGHIITFAKTNEFIPRSECRTTLSRFVNLLLNQKSLLLRVFLFSAAISAVGILGAFIFQIIIDNIQNIDTASLFSSNSYGLLNLGRICSALIILYIFQAVIAFFRGKAMAELSNSIDIPLILGYYNHTVDLPMNFFDTISGGEIMSRFSDASHIRDAISAAALSLMLDGFMVIFCGFILCRINFSLFIISLLTLTLYGAIIFCFLKPLKSINQTVMENNAEVTSYLKESIDGVETIKSFGAENLAKEKIKQKFLKMLKNIKRGAVISTLQDTLSGTIASIGIIIILWFGTHLVIKGDITLGTLITFYSLFGYFLEPIQNLIELQPEMQTAVIAADRLNDILDAETEKSNSQSDFLSLYGNILFDNVSFRYGNRSLTLKNINISINAGSSVALIGESGCGKTTLAKLLMSFYPPECGKIHIGSTDISQLSPIDIRKRIAYIPQEIFLFSDTVKNNLTLSNPLITDEEIEQACRASGADKFIKSLPLGYNTRLGENGHDLSGGQKQRLAIARALLKKPDILILDEATSNLDTISENNIKNTINQLKNITCIIIAHRLTTIKNCSKIFVMRDGEIVESGTHDELLAANGLYKKFYDENV